MATPLGADHISAIVNRHLMDDIIDLAYDGNPLFYRLHNSNRRFVDGGPVIEQPLMVSKFTQGGSFHDLDVLDMSPQDTLRTAAWDWKEKYVPVAFSNLTMVKLNTADSIANGVEVQVQQAAMTMRDLLGSAIYHDNTADPDAKEIDSLVDAIDDNNTYGGINRNTSGNEYWQSAPIDNSNAGVTLPKLNSWQTAAVTGGRFPSIAVTSSLIYNEIWDLLSGKQNFYTTNEKDTQMAAAGFNNFMFNGTPFLIDPNLTGKDSLFFLNEDFIKLAVTPMSDFRMEPFMQAYNQAAIGAKLLWTGNLLCTAPKLQTRVIDVTTP